MYQSDSKLEVDDLVSLSIGELNKIEKIKAMPKETIVEYKTIDNSYFKLFGENILILKKYHNYLEISYDDKWEERVQFGTFDIISYDHDDYGIYILVDVKNDFEIFFGGKNIKETSGFYFMFYSLDGNLETAESINSSHLDMVTSSGELYFYGHHDEPLYINDQLVIPKYNLYSFIIVVDFNLNVIKKRYFDKISIKMLDVNDNNAIVFSYGDNVYFEHEDNNWQRKIKKIEQVYFDRGHIYVHSKGKAIIRLDTSGTVTGKFKYYKNSRFCDNIFYYLTNDNVLVEYDLNSEKIIWQENYVLDYHCYQHYIAIKKGNIIDIRRKTFSPLLGQVRKIICQCDERVYIVDFKKIQTTKKLIIGENYYLSYDQNVLTNGIYFLGVAIDNNTIKITKK